MRYILAEYIALRSWRLIPYAYYIKNQSAAKGLKKEMFEQLLLCDGKTEISENSLIEDALKLGLIRKAVPGDALTEWQKYHHCDNRCMPRINLQITAKCNYNCLHCFNAVDNAPLMEEMSYEKIVALLDEAQKCGVSSFTVTGGEPMLHKHFTDIVREIYKRDMFIDDLNTNGYFLKQETLDFFKEIGCNPFIKISFDGIGFHNWMRGRKGAEDDAMRAIQLCIENGFRVMVQYNINKKNESTIFETLDKLDEMGVDLVRVICTTPAPRWEQNAKGQSYSFEEYMEVALDIVKHYIERPHRTVLMLWQIMTLYPKARAYTLIPVKKTEVRFRKSIPICKNARSMIAIGSNGQVYPCLQSSGFMDAHNIDLGNIYRDGLQKILQGGKFMDCVCQTIDDRTKNNGKCGNCKYFHYCFGGCPALGLLYSPRMSMLDPDPTKCIFFEQGYYEKFTSLLDGYHNNNVMDEFE